MITFADLLEAYYLCRQHKRNTANALLFEIDYENKLLNLYHEIISGRYKTSRHIAFIVKRPVRREIFAADFRDRVVHHLVVNRFNPLFAKQFIYDSYACRQDKGTLFGIRRVVRFIRQCTQNYTRPAYVLKLDIKNYFVDIDKDILYRRLEKFTAAKYKNDDHDLLLQLCREIIFNDPTIACVRKSSLTEWQKLPPGKSMFGAVSSQKGLPIGNLTSQTFSNFYLDVFDHFVKHNLGIRYYGRYVDDMVIVHEDKEFLKKFIKIAADYLSDRLGLKVHPRKIYLQPIEYGVEFLGVRIFPHRIIMAERIKKNISKKIRHCNWLLVNNKVENKIVKDKIRASVNSYLGTLMHFNTYQYRQAIIEDRLASGFRNYFAVAGGYNKIMTI
ncbi:MAG: Reverse transcriptase (RNA-dependent DNA polymerase) [Parcubacteria group bacterium ADurb.Bin316]|nr:MAG: Reverse transcriptase (RNA-dependent DNA polymerase) [Parcubacteria group bacterium ADurb.Bin316]HOZ55816.1 RNA-directed DNA polymerase [bacterium]